jgi:hypothetical protein
VQLFQDRRRIDQTVFIDPLGVGQLDFDIDAAQKDKLVWSGRQAVYILNEDQLDHSTGLIGGRQLGLGRGEIKAALRRALRTVRSNSAASGAGCCQKAIFPASAVRP